MTGKRVGQYLYIHISATGSLPKDIQDNILHYSKILKERYNFEYYDVIKIGIKTPTISFIQTIGWDTLPEPFITKVYKVTSNGAISFHDYTKQNIIYHHKWMFVNSDYKGFNIEESKQRSEYWERHPEILKMRQKDSTFKSKIGNYWFWKENVLNKIFCEQNT
jgi:hypothetical protein